MIIIFHVNYTFYGMYYYSYYYSHAFCGDRDHNHILNHESMPTLTPSCFVVARCSRPCRGRARGCLQDKWTALIYVARYDQTGAVVKPLLGALQQAGILKEALQATDEVLEARAAVVVLFADVLCYIVCCPAV